MLANNRLFSRLNRKEKQQLNDDLIEQKESEKKSLMDQLTSLKDAELLAMKQGWESKVNELLQQVSLFSLITHRFSCFCFHVVEDFISNMSYGIARDVTYVTQRTIFGFRLSSLGRNR
jgi:hypothetical protein